MGASNCRNYKRRTKPSASTEGILLVPPKQIGNNHSPSWTGSSVWGMTGKSRHGWHLIQPCSTRSDWPCLLSLKLEAPCSTRSRSKLKWPCSTRSQKVQSLAVQGQAVQVTLHQRQNAGTSFTGTLDVCALRRRLRSSVSSTTSRNSRTGESKDRLRRDESATQLLCSVLWDTVVIQTLWEMWTGKKTKEKPKKTK